jgi:uncharacterized protein (UPF0276 family)
LEESVNESIPRPWPPFPVERPLLGANGSGAMLAVLDDRGDGLLDYLKVGPFMGREAMARLALRFPLMLHLDLILSGDAPLGAAQRGEAQGWLELTGAPWTSAHIGFAVPDVTLDEALITQPASRLLPRDRALGNISRNARILGEGLSAPLLLENLPLFPNAAHMGICEASFVREVLERSGCGLLLDLAHARVSADVLGVEVREYLEQFPLDRTVELHLSGPRRLEELGADRRARVMANAAGVADLLRFTEANLVDAHEPLQEEDYRLLEWVLGRCRPRALTLEYYWQPEPLREQLERLAAMIGR